MHNQESGLVYTKQALTQRVLENAASAFWKFLEILKMEENEEEDAEEEDAEEEDEEDLVSHCILDLRTPLPP